MQQSRLAMSPYRKQRTAILKSLAGEHYSENAARKKRYLDLVGLWMSVISRNLIAKEPRIMLSTDSREDEGAVAFCEEWVNEEIVRLNMADEWHKIVIDALISIGVAMVSIATPADAENSALGLKVGDPFMRRISLDDFVIDMSANDINEIQYIGFRGRYILDVIKSSSLYNKRAREDVQETLYSRYNQEGDERANWIGKSNYQLWGEYEPMVDLWTVYCPREKCVYTLTDDSLTGPTASRDNNKVIPLREAEWVGPSTGPFHLLMLGIPISDNILPKGPILSVIDLDESTNENYRKLMRQAARLKDVTVVRKGNVEDNQRIQDSNDGDLLPVDDPGAAKAITMGGPNQGLFLLLQDQVTRFSWLSGNLEAMGGLAPQAGTLGQEELLHSQSNGQIALMQSAVARFVHQTVHAKIWFWWHHPTKTMKSKYTQDGMPDVSLTRELHPWDKQGPMMVDAQGNLTQKKLLKRDGEMPKVRINAYSLREMTPQQRSQKMTQILTQIYVPLAQMAQQQGVAFDFNAYLEIIGKLEALPELKKVLTTTNATAPEESAESAPPTETTRNYVRHDGKNPLLQDNAEMETMLESGMSENQNGRFNGAMQ
jgi:hypothetical protein